MSGCDPNLHLGGLLRIPLSPPVNARPFGHLARRCRCRVAYPVANDDDSGALTLASMPGDNTGASGRESTGGGPIVMPCAVAARLLERGLDATARLMALMSVSVAPWVHAA